MNRPDIPMTLAEFIDHEVKRTKECRHPNAISVRFVQLHEQDKRNEFEQREYNTLYLLMRSRWRFHKASLEATKARPDT